MSLTPFPPLMHDREQTIFSTKAHIFQIDPQTKKNWRPCSSEAVPVTIVAEPRSVFRVSAGEAGKPIVNSYLTHSSLFTKTSPKFGQWTDLRAGTVYGLGFPGEAELIKVLPDHRVSLMRAVFREI